MSEQVRRPVWNAPGLEKISGVEQVESGKYTWTTEANDVLSVPSGPV